MSDLARVLRILAKHANACADELEGVLEEEPPLSPADKLAEAKRQQAERHAQLSGK